MELQQELLWKIVERELGMGLISCEPLNAGGSADVYRATVKGSRILPVSNCFARKARRGWHGRRRSRSHFWRNTQLSRFRASILCTMQRRRNRSKRLGWN